MCFIGSVVSMVIEEIKLRFSILVTVFWYILDSSFLLKQNNHNSLTSKIPCCAVWCKHMYHKFPSLTFIIKSGQNICLFFHSIILKSKFYLKLPSVPSLHLQALFQWSATSCKYECRCYLYQFQPLKYLNTLEI